MFKGRKVWTTRKPTTNGHMWNIQVKHLTVYCICRFTWKFENFKWFNSVTWEISHKKSLSYPILGGEGGQL